MPVIIPQNKNYKAAAGTIHKTRHNAVPKSAIPSYKIGEAAELLGVSAQTMRRWADSAGLLRERVKGQHRRIDGGKLAEFIQGRQDSEASSTGQNALSARNRFQGLVTRVIKDKVTAQVEIQAGKYRIVALTTREAADSLGLIPGVMASAAIKSTNVIVEKSEL